jgi:hypothetical protein
MNRLYLLLTFSFILFTSVFATEKDTLDKRNAGQTFEVKVGKTVMKISANGGRIISYRIGKNEFLTCQSQHENFGSTLWTAPQSEWNWPPYAELDSLKYRVESTGDVVKMISQQNSKSGFQFEKSWQAVGSDFIRIEYVIRNISATQKSVAPWEVTRVPCGGIAFFPDGGNGNVPQSSLLPDLQSDGINWVSIDKNPGSKHVKLFSTAREGWLAYALNGVLFIKQFPDILPENYPPQQGEVEIYTNKDKSYSELENHGSYRLLQPMETCSYVVNWYLFPIPKKVKVKEGNPKLTSFSRHQISRLITDNH